MTLYGMAKGIIEFAFQLFAIFTVTSFYNRLTVFHL